MHVHFSRRRVGEHYTAVIIIKRGIFLKLTKFFSHGACTLTYTTLTKEGDYIYTMHFVEFLIPHLANVNVTDRAGRTSLHHAAFNGHVEVK